MTFFDDTKSMVKKMIRPKKDELNGIDDWINHYNFKENYGQGLGYKYNTNEHGFRSDEFIGDDGIIFLGCSLTYGYGLEEDETWPWIVGKHFQSKVWNLAMSGHGDDACFIVAQKWIPKLKPKLVCMLTPPPGRYVFFHTPFDDSTLWRIVAAVEEVKYPFLFSSEQMYVQSLKNILGIKSICESFKIPFIVKSSEEVVDKKSRVIKDIFKRKSDLARDGLHPGPKWQKKKADEFINQINKDKICI